jgi:hypothetical protein
VITAIQAGSASNLTVFQNGGGNTIQAAQTDGSNSATVTQNGNDNIARAVQSTVSAGPIN